MDRRYRRVLATAALSLTLVCGIAAAVMRGQASTALRERDEALEVVRFLVDQFQLQPARQGFGEAVTAREILDAGTRKFEDGGLGLPADRPAALGALGSAYLGLGLHSEAERLLQWSLSLRGERRPGAGRVIHLLDLATVQVFEGRCDEAANLRAEAAGLVADGVGDLQLVRYLDDRAFSVNHRMGHPWMAENLYRLALAIKLRGWGEDHAAVARTRQNLAVALELQSKYEEAAKHLERTVETHKALHGEDSAEAARAQSALAAVLRLSSEPQARPWALRRTSTPPGACGGPGSPHSPRAASP